MFWFDLFYYQPLLACWGPSFPKGSREWVGMRVCRGSYRAHTLLSVADCLPAKILPWAGPG